MIHIYIIHLDKKVHTDEIRKVLGAKRVVNLITWNSAYNECAEILSVKKPKQKYIMLKNSYITNEKHFTNKKQTFFNRGKEYICKIFQMLKWR